MTTQALAIPSSVITNLQAAAGNIGSGSGTGETYLKIDDRDGRVTFGQEGLSLPTHHKFVVGLHGFRHGYINMSSGTVVERNVVPMAEQSQRPVPAGGKYGTYEGGGPRDVTEIVLNSIDEPGFDLVFTAWGVSSANRVRNLLNEAILHVNSPDGLAGFVHPVITVRSGNYPLKAKVLPNGTQIPARNVHHFDYARVDWLHVDGKTLLSARGPEGSIEDSKDEITPPWEDDEDLDEDVAVLSGNRRAG